MSSLRIATQVLAGVFGGNEEVFGDDLPRDEEFLATVLMMFKREDPWTGDMERYEAPHWSPHDMEALPHDEENSGLDGEAGSSSLEEEPRRRIRPKKSHRKLVRGIEMQWNQPTESYGIVKPKSTHQYQLVVRWSLSQLPFHCGTADEIFAGVKAFGWPELKKGGSREHESCRRGIERALGEGFVEKGVNERGEAVYCEGEVLREDSLTRTTPTKRRREEGKKVERRAKREVRRKPSLLSEEVAEEAWWEEEAGILSDERRAASGGKKQAGTSSVGLKDNGGRGRRWVRFACEKHRREHARCPDNCAMRKKSYVDEQVNGDMDIESCDLQGEPAEGVVADDGEMD